MTTDESIISILLTKSVFVNISPVPIVVQQQPPALLEIKEGDDFTIRCIVHSYPEPCYQWFRDNTRLEGETSNILHVSAQNINTVITNKLQTISLFHTNKCFML